jgi:ribosomal protein L22
MTMTELETPQVRAVAKWVRISPRKARLVIDHIRGRTVPEARTVLAFTTRAAARDIEKVLRSAVANAEANHNLIGDDLYISEAHVDDGLTIKRWQPRARGRVARIKKRTCHITIKLSPVDGAVLPPPPVEVEPEEVDEVAEVEQVEAVEDVTEAEAVDEVVEAEEEPTTASSGALTPEEQKAEEAKPKRAPRRKAAPKAEAEEEAEEPMAETGEPKEAPKKRTPRVRRKKKEGETES